MTTQATSHRHLRPEEMRALLTEEMSQLEFHERFARYRSCIRCYSTAHTVLRALAREMSPEERTQAFGALTL